MTLLEAIKSGKRFKLPFWTGYINFDHKHSRFITFSKNDILSDDWEIEPEKKPRLLAYVNSSGCILMFNNGGEELYGFERVPHLDEPEEK